MNSKFRSIELGSISAALIIAVLMLFNYPVIAQTPYFTWARQAGGDDPLRGLCITTDDFGNISNIGNFFGTISFDSIYLTSVGGCDIFFTKYDESGNVLWAQQAGGDGDDYPESATTDNWGNTIITGWFESDTASFGPIKLVKLTGIADTDIFIAKYDASGNVLWAKSAGGNWDDRGTAVTTDASGNILITGTFGGTADFGPITLTGIDEEIFIAKYDASGNILWAKLVSSEYFAGVNSIVTDGLGNSIITGGFDGTLSFDSITLTSAGNRDIFIAKYDASGNVLWAKGAGGEDIDYGKKIITDGLGNYIISGEFGQTASFDNITINKTNYGSKFIAKYDASGNALWARPAHGIAIAIDASGNTTHTGDFSNTIYFDSITLTSAGGRDIFIAKYDNLGNVIWAIRAGGSEDVYLYGSDTDNLGGIIFTGEFSGIASFGSHTLTKTNFQSIYIAKCNEIDIILEAEEMQNRKPWYGSPIDNGWKLTHKNHPIYNYVAFPSDTSYYFSVTAKGETASKAAPWMKVELGNIFSGCCEVNSTEWADYSFTAAVPAGIYQLRLTFLNDWWKKNVGDRNLLLDKVEINYQSIIPPPSTSFTFEAENMKYQHPKNYQDGGFIVLNRPYAYVGQDMFLKKQELTFVIYAKGYFAASDWPQMNLKIDGQIKGSVEVDDNSSKAYLFNITNINPGKRRIKITYRSDSWSKGRNLLIDKLVILNPDGGLLKPVVDHTDNEEYHSDIPENFALGENYPNPFNPDTYFTFQLPEDSHVIIMIFNTKGQEVRTLVNEDKSAGHYTVHWDGKDNHSNRTVSGIYIYHIKAENFIFSKKMVLLK